MEQKICHVSKSWRSGFTEILIAQKRVSVLNRKTNTISVSVLGRWEEVKKKKGFLSSIVNMTVPLVCK